MKIKEIVSETNATFRTFLKLNKTRGIKKNRLALLSGLRPVREILQEFSDQCVAVIFTDQQQLPSECKTGDHTIYYLKPNLFRQIDFHNTGRPILLVRVPEFPPWIDGTLPSGCTLFIPFQDPANVGAVIRSAAAFGVLNIVMLKEAAHPFHPKSNRAAGSSLFRVVFHEGPSLARINIEKMPIVTLSPKGRDIGAYQFPHAFCLIPGLEGQGLPDHLKKLQGLSIPMEPGVESLNAALATGIALYIWNSKLKGG